MTGTETPGTGRDRSGWTRSCWRSWPARTPTTARSTVDEAASELLCTTCDRAFPVRDGIPVLLLDEARHRSP